MPDIGLSVQAYWRYTVFANNSQRVLLTGATGYLGVHLLAQLLKRTSCQVFCLVRPPPGSEDRPAAARQRLVSEWHSVSSVDVPLVDVAQLEAGGGGGGRSSPGL